MKVPAVAFPEADPGPESPPTFCGAATGSAATCGAGSVGSTGAGAATGDGWGMEEEVEEGTVVPLEKVRPP